MTIFENERKFLRHTSYDPYERGYCNLQVFEQKFQKKPAEKIRRR
jgi:hypothetical protein